MIFDARTGFLFLGIIVLVISLALWAALWQRRSRALHLWCSGGLAAAGASFLLAWRGMAPAPLGFHVAMLLAVLMLVLKIQAIRLELGEAERVLGPMVLLLAFVVAYELLSRGPRPEARFLVVALIMLALNAHAAWWAMRLARRQGRRSAYWIAVAFGLMAAMYAFRLTNAVLGNFDAELMTQGYDALVMALASLVGAIIANIAWLGLSLERLVQEQVTAAAAQARGEENRLLGDQIARLERQRSLGLLSASLAHELNQPLTAILTNAQVIERGLGKGRIDPARLLELIDKVLHNTRRVIGIIERIRELIRPGPRRSERIDLRRVVTEVADLVVAEARQHGTTVHLALPDTEVLVLGDPVQVSQILLNLLRNAIEATAGRAEREVGVQLRGADGRAQLTVRDTGPGLDPEALERAGQPFFTSKPRGLGLGLSISRAIAAQHGGQLTLGNAAAGGALAELELPLCPSSNEG